MAKIVETLQKIENIVEENIGKTLTDDVATDIYQLTNDIMCKYQKFTR